MRRLDQQQRRHDRHVPPERQVHLGHHHQADHQTDHPLALQVGQLAVTLPLPRVGGGRRLGGAGGRLLGSGRGFGGWDLADAVAGALDRGAQGGQVGDGRVVGDGGALRGEVDVRRGHAGDLFQSLLDAPHAGGAGHAFDRKDGFRCSGGAASSLPFPLGGAGTGFGRDDRLRREIGHAVAGALDRRGNVGHGRLSRVIADRRPLGGQVDRRAFDPRDLADRLLDAVDARGAGHPGHRETDVDRRRCRGRKSCRHRLATPVLGIHESFPDIPVGVYIPTLQA